MRIEPIVLMIDAQSAGIVYILGPILFHGLLENKILSLALALSRNIVDWLFLQQKCHGLDPYFMNWVSTYHPHQSFGVIILVLRISQSIRSFMPALSISRITNILCGKKWPRRPLLMIFLLHRPNCRYFY